MCVYVVCYAASLLLARSGHDYLSGAALMVSALYLYWYDYRRSENLIHLRGLFSLFWVGGQGISCLRLSRLQPAWSQMTWACFFLAFSCFWLVFEAMSRRHGTPRAVRPRRQNFASVSERIFHAIAAVTVISSAAFVFEAVWLGYIPLLVRGVPHAYSEFHVTGVHYLTVSCVLVPALSVVYLFAEPQLRRPFSCGRTRFRQSEGLNRRACVFIMDLVAVAIPLLCVSRFQLILALLLAAFTYIALQKRIRPIHAASLFAVLLPLYLLLTAARSHSIGYLNGIFEMKNGRMPIFITQPYMYIANNYANFNELVQAISEHRIIQGQEIAHTLGLRMLFPVWALTGLKFLAPELVSSPIVVVKKELTTVTLFYDAYYDFGWIGVAAFSCLLGLAAYRLMRNLSRVRNPVVYLAYAQIAVYMVFSFFTTWFSNPATWFYLGVTAVIYLYCYWK